MTNLEFHAKQTGSQLLAWISHFFSFLQACSMHSHCTLIAFCRQFDMKTHVDLSLVDMLKRFDWSCE